MLQAYNKPFRITKIIFLVIFDLKKYAFLSEANNSNISYPTTYKQK